MRQRKLCFQPVRKANAFNGEIMALEVEFLVQRHICCGLSCKRVAIEVGDRLDHLFGTRLLPGHNQGRERIERIKQEMRVNLISQTSNFCSLGCAAKLLLSSFCQTRLGNRNKREIERAPRQHHEIAPESDLSQRRQKRQKGFFALFAPMKFILARRGPFPAIVGRQWNILERISGFG